MEQLPCEILYQIFDRLDLASVKNASLTCKRWAWIIFSDQYIKRFRMRVDVSPLCVDNWPSKMYYLQWVVNSKRTYVHLTFDFAWAPMFQDPAFDTLFSGQFRHQLEHLVVLKLVLRTDPDELVMRVLNTLPTMGRLTALHITLANKMERYLQTRSELVLRSETVRHLELEAFLPVGLVLPRLRSLVVTVHLRDSMVSVESWATQPPQVNVLYSALLAKLEELTFSCFDHSRFGYLSGWHEVGINRPGYMVHIYQHLPRVKKLHLFESKTGETSFRAICGSCTTLTDLRIKCLQVVDPNALRDLSSLAQLRRLTIEEFVGSGPISFNRAQLPRLEYLRLGLGTFAYDSFRELGAVKALTLTVTVVDIEQAFRAIANYLPLLTTLTLNLHGLENSTVLLKLLHRLPTVRELVLEEGFFCQGIFSNSLLQPMDGLRTLRFRRCRMRVPEMVSLRRLFPNLTQLDMPRRDVPLGPPLPPVAHLDSSRFHE